jgi:hypothetical protein
VSERESKILNSINVKLYEFIEDFTSSTPPFPFKYYSYGANKKVWASKNFIPSPLLFFPPPLLHLHLHLHLEHIVKIFELYDFKLCFISGLPNLFGIKDFIIVVDQI